MNRITLAVALATAVISTACGGGDIDANDSADALLLDEVYQACLKAHYDYSANGKKGTPPAPCRPNAA